MQSSDITRIRELRGLARNVDTNMTIETLLCQSACQTPSTGTGAVINGTSLGTTVIYPIGSQFQVVDASGFYVRPVRGRDSIMLGHTSVVVYDELRREFYYDTTTGKTFVIQHPDDEDKYLVHACLEGPEVGVYYRGKAYIDCDMCIVQLPKYTKNLATDYTVSVTPIYNGKIRTLNATNVENGEFKVYGESGEFHWTVYAKRCNYLEVEPDKDDVDICGDGPYKWIV
jgi:hypothetical protein